jgi:hypothetical protein
MVTAAPSAVQQPPEVGHASYIQAIVKITDAAQAHGIDPSLVLGPGQMLVVEFQVGARPLPIATTAAASPPAAILGDFSVTIRSSDESIPWVAVTAVRSRGTVTVSSAATTYAFGGYQISQDAQNRLTFVKVPTAAPGFVSRLPTLVAAPPAPRNLGFSTLSVSVDFFKSLLATETVTPNGPVTIHEKDLVVDDTNRHLTCFWHEQPGAAGDAECGVRLPTRVTAYDLTSLTLQDRFDGAQAKTLYDHLAPAAPGAPRVLTFSAGPDWDGLENAGARTYRVECQPTQCLSELKREHGDFEM